MTPSSEKEVTCLMPPKSKSLFRGPDVKHFQLVHRSQRDPLIHDPDASQHVLKEFQRENVRRGKNRADLENLIDPSDLAHDLSRSNIGQAATYGIFYDDTEYDYMQHLRQVGEKSEGYDSVLIEAPKPVKPKSNGKVDILDLLPPEVLPSKTELQIDYESQQAIPSSIAGFQPDMDPHLRQVLEALDDDAFVDDELDDGFFDELVKEGERPPDEEPDFEFQEDERPSGSGLEGEKLDKSKDWEAQFALFKKSQQSRTDDASEGGDTVSTLPQLSVIGGKRRRKGTSDASGYSMSSSSMFRNEGLTLLDERFDKIERVYEEDEEDGGGDHGQDADDGDDEAPQLITSREDFDAIMDDFLDNYELVGNKIRPVLAGETGPEKLDTLRRAMITDNESIKRMVLSDQDRDEDEIPMPKDIDDYKDRWDCETILTTYSNTENHPRLIRAREGPPVKKIHVDPRTGLPVTEDEISQRNIKTVSGPHDSESDSDDTETEGRPIRQTVTRPRTETKEEKKARKRAVKDERQTRRIDKKATREQFSNERKHQIKVLAGKTVSLKKL